jgi:hypothetical protein
MPGQNAGRGLGEDGGGGGGGGSMGRDVAKVLKKLRICHAA